MAGKQQERVNVEGHELTLTNLGKIIYPETGTTKAEVLEYYAAVAPFLIPAAANRPVTRKRWVNGVGTAEHPGQVFFQKNLEDSAPKWIPRAAIEHSDHTNVYPMVNNLATLTWMAQIASLEIHVPQWQVDPSGKPLRPDRFVLDLDPGPGAGLPECVEVAKLARSILQDMGMDPVPVTSGSKGIHLYTGLDGTLKSEQVSAFAKELARALESDHPDLVVSDMKKSLRHGKVLVDWSQNSGNKTTIVPYSLRGKAHPTVAAPRTWRELASPSLDHLDYLAVMKRVATGKDHFAPISDRHLPPHGEDENDGDARERVVTVENRLAKYVGMRDPGKTPEPFPSSSAVSASSQTGRSSSGQPKPGDPPPPGGIFVIQEHHARRYHLDLRLEHNGVLASWALPRGVPETPERNNLAVHTEDHPMEYATFAGVIPKGEYGAGTMTIWDRGEYTCEKWRDDKEVIATLTGEPGGGLGGTKRLALINTGQNWLIHLMKEQPGVRRKSPGSPPKASSPETAPSPPTPMPNYTPMLATSGTIADLRGDDWLYELKWDGIRAIITGTEGKIRLMSRNGNDLTATYPELTDRSCWPDGDFVADGEIVALGKGSRPDFGRLQQRMNLVKAGDIERARASVPVQLMLFDLLHDDGTDLSGLPFRERRERLSGFADRLRKGCPLHLSMVLDHDVEDLMASAGELGLEGVMAKKADSRYVIGRRSRSWIKLKLEQSQEVVVGGWRPGAGARGGTFGALLLGVPDGDKLHYVGRVGTGFKDWQLRDVMEHLEPRVVSESPFADIPREDAAGATWVRPELVAEVTFGEWTGPGRLRHPVWRGWRPDKSPEDVSQPN
ncbi:ATP-dependent DNA ligase [Paenarthrobacter aurescens]|uniref:DNA ligase (ATP) n=1 Tax=Paenarthrobacter aurescens TaxID=43663 RepID=A0A4Y3ND85_PAEAU|nr:ATP-dependent DNA ligase [Paenarthrobacter aurescens]MDO6141990.1 ATP-dependent DNA ligase [Paenarthrobacter aurescens]MDO6145795.1 ATP-dependent DNA ligase [Paenarthrobacter aurescens]MDO6157039.1 ATP-dependent DNA ligase [Paenarthrobacter aurescens]MDO6161025.1 ATP-dependent DNA ligase [Paenarthrobacter aurescens]GEB19203.1 ATP-dependent DNA ligase [Paenarthrobacter aurescens]